MFDSLLGHGERVYHTGGYLGGGEVVWLLARLPESIQVRGDDVLEPYLLFTNSHDGSIAIDIRLTTVRVVCQNTLSLALRSPKKKQVFRRAHRGSYDLVKAEASGFFKFALNSAREAQELFKRLANKGCDDAQFQSYLAKLLREPAKPVTADTHPAVKKGYETRVETIRQMRSQILQVHRQGLPERRIPAAKYNWWEVLNSVTAWVDHVQETEGDRYAHILLGGGDRLKATALELVITEMANA
jgi:phage/plasmid-like protein (TIGR03299 family)